MPGVVLVSLLLLFRPSTEAVGAAMPRFDPHTPAGGMDEGSPAGGLDFGTPSGGMDSGSPSGGFDYGTPSSGSFDSGTPG